MNTYKLVLIALSLYTLLLLVAPLVMAQPQAVDLDARGGYYSGSISLSPGVVQSFIFYTRIYDTVTLTITPTTVSTVDITIKNPDGGIVKTMKISEKTSIPINIDIKGAWAVELASKVQQIVHIELVGHVSPPPSPTPLPTPTPPILLEHIILIIGGGAIVVIALVAVFALRKRPAPPPTPPAPVQPPPTAPPLKPGGEETAVLEKKLPVAAKETEMMIAALELPSGGVIPVTSPRQVFGRADFERYVDPSLLSYISRRHFMITLEPGGFFIEDLGSANGTTLNDADIRGKGKVPLKSGDTIGVGGVLKLRFRVAG
jgi:hypothetical protein